MGLKDILSNLTSKSIPVPDTKQIKADIQEENIHQLKKYIDKSNVNSLLLADDSGFFQIEEPLLAYAIHENKIEVVQWLLAMGADLNQIIEEESSFYKDLLYAESDSLLLALLKHGLPANINVAGSFYVQSFIALAIQMQKSTETLLAIIHAGGLGLAEDAVSPIQCALTYYPDPLVLAALVQNDSPLGSDDPLAYLYTLMGCETLSESDRCQLVGLFIEHYHINPNLTWDNQLPLITLAFNQKWKSLVLMLIEKGADPHILGKESLLHMFRLSELSTVQSILIDAQILDPTALRQDFTYAEFKAFMAQYDDLLQIQILFPLVRSNSIHFKQRLELMTLALSKNANANEVDLNHFPEDERLHLLAFMMRLPHSYENTAYIQLLLDHGACVEYKDFSALYEALASYKPQWVDLLLTHGADVNYKDKYQTGWIHALYDNPSHVNTAAKRIELFKKLDAYGLDLYAEEFYFSKNEGHDTLLDVAIHHEDSAFIEMLVDAHPEFFKDILGSLNRFYNMRLMIEKRLLSLVHLEKIVAQIENISRVFTFSDGGQNTLLGRIMDSFNANADHYDYYFKAVEILLKHGADPNIPLVFPPSDYKEGYRDAMSILEIAVSWGLDRLDMVKLLHQYGADHNKRYSQLDESIIFGLIQRFSDIPDDRVLDYLNFFWENGGFDMNQTNAYLSTPYLSAAQLCRAPVVKWLFDHGAKTKISGGFDNSYALHKAISNYDTITPEKRAKTVAALLACGEEIDQFDHDDYSPLMVAAHYGCTSAVKVLLQQGANVHLENASGMTALHYGAIGNYGYDFSHRVESNQCQIIQLLAQAGADINQANQYGVSPLMSAIRYGYKEIFSSLLALNADSQQKDFEHRSPLMDALDFGDIFFVNKLWPLNQDWTAVDHQQETLLMKCLARENAKESILLSQKLLREHAEALEPTDLPLIAFVAKLNQPDRVKKEKIAFLIQLGQSLEEAIVYCQQKTLVPFSALQLLKSL